MNWLEKPYPIDMKFDAHVTNEKNLESNDEVFKLLIQQV